MSIEEEADLSRVDGKWLEGFDFCRTVYGFFDRIRSGQNGIAKLRLRPTKLEKKLIEELIPLARYIQSRYQEGRRIDVRWQAGSQSYDAKLLSTGVLVDLGIVPQEVFIEITTSVHPNEHLLRELAQKGGVVFSTKKTSRNRKTKQIVSEPYASCDDEHIAELSDQISEAINKKKIDSYPIGTVLLVNCILDRPFADSEWSDAIERVKLKTRLEFEEIFMTSHLGLHSATLFKDRK